MQQDQCQVSFLELKTFSIKCLPKLIQYLETMGLMRNAFIFRYAFIGTMIKIKKIFFKYHLGKLNQKT